MAEAPEVKEVYREMDLGLILRAIYGQKWLILALTLLVGIVTAVVSLTKPNIYESTAALIVRDPQSALSEDPENPGLVQETPTLTVETLQTLTESTEIKWTLFEALWSKQAILEWAQSPLDKEALFQGFQGSLFTELRTKRDRRSAGAAELLPILYLRVRATSPETAQIIANEWATIVETKSREIYTQSVEATDVFIGDMYKQSNDALLMVERDLAATTLEAGLALKNARLKSLTDKISLLEDAILDIDIELAVNKVAIEEGTLRVAEQEIEGEWIGAVAEDALLRNEPYPFDVEMLSEQAHKVLELVEQKVVQREAAREFRREQKLLTKEKTFAHLQADLERIMLEKAKVEDELPGVESALASLTARLETLPEKLSLSKAITDEALWNSFLTGEGAGEKAMTPLESETMNPAYQATLQTSIETTTKLETLRASAVRLVESELEVKEQLKELELEIDLIQQEIDRRTAALEATSGSLTLLRDDFLAEKNRVEELKITNLRKSEEKETRMKTRTEMELLVEALEEDLSTFKLKIDQLTREVEKTSNVRTALASKAEAVALLQVAAENASRTGTAVLYQAQANPNKVAPSRSKLVLASMLGAALLGIFLVCAWEVARPPA